jgi:hypothetical protein
MCGATSGQKAVGASQMSFLTDLTSQAKTEFAGFNDIINSMVSRWKPILDAGINQRGMSDSERTARQTEATEHVADVFTRAKEGTANAIAGAGGGAGRPSGAELQLNANVETAAAGEQSDLQNKIVSDYAMGRENFLSASNAMGSIAGMENPAGIAGAVTNAGNAAANTENEIAQADQAWMAPVFGAIGGAASAALTRHK